MAPAAADTATPVATRDGVSKGTVMGKWGEGCEGDVPCVGNTHHSQCPSVHSSRALLGELAGTGLSQPVPHHHPKEHNYLWEASSPLLTAPLKRCHSGCQDRAHP